MLKRPVFYIASIVAAFAIAATAIPAHAALEDDPIFCDEWGTLDPPPPERDFLSRAEINAAFPSYTYSDELVSTTNRVEGAYRERQNYWVEKCFRFVDDVTGLSDWVAITELAYGPWTGPYIGTVAGVPQAGTRDCLKSHEMTLAGPLQQDLTVMPQQVTTGFTLDNPALLNRNSKETSYGQNPQANWLDCVNAGASYNTKSSTFLKAEQRLANGDIVELSPARAKRLMGYQGRYKIASEVKMSQVSYRSYPNSFVYGSYSGVTVPLSVDAPASRTTSTVDTWFLRDCKADRTLAGSLQGGERPYALFAPRGGSVLSLQEEASWMKTNCPDIVGLPPGGPVVGSPPPVMECALVSREDGVTDVIANPIYRSRDASTNAYLGEYRGFSDWIQPTTVDLDFQVKADNKFVWADFLRYADLTVRLGGDAEEVTGSGASSLRKWSSFMGLSDRVRQNSPSLVGTLTNGGPGPNDDLQPFDVARQPLDEDGNYVQFNYGQDSGEGERAKALKNYDRLALNSWYGPGSVFDFDNAESALFPGFMVAFSAASQPSEYWGVKPRWGVSSVISYTKDMPEGALASVSSPSSIVVNADGLIREKLTEVLMSDACTASRQARFDVTVPSIVR